MRRLLFGLTLLLALAQARAEEHLFYQPLNADAALSQEDWTQLWQASAQQGVRTLVVQWSAYGDADFGGHDGWLAQSLREARTQGLELVLGLYMDPDYYQRLNGLDSAGLASYWQYQLGRSLALQQRLRQDWQLPVAGWYLPLELDDLNFHAPERRQALHAQLKDFAGQLDAPLHLSAFTGGRLAPQVYAGWLGGLGELGIQVWWQDGAGTARLEPLVRQAYERALPCTVGVVREAFRQTSTEGQPFAAQPAKPGALDTACRRVAVFELRYRPWGARLRK
ncbi:DUF4434 family protein [Pseudomonas sp. LS44]|uniref:DUF4434 family protein n=1 Tax=Pseudomonas sp. LS44 TaxID=1357074 RepID=UPI00215A2FC4|nr:DUF4434 family protein [Pseudomonas sp. LS44]UVE16720.1 DUF4434 family protein [Pseudomonas sp. LS44]